MRTEPRVVPPTPTATPGAPVMWLMQAPVDIMDTCIHFMSDAGRISLGRALRLSPEQMLQPQQRLVADFSEHLAAGNRRSWVNGIALGPLKAALVSALSKQGNVEAHDARWTKVAERTQAQLARSQQKREALELQAKALHVAPEAARDLATAVVALDALSAAAPDTLSWITLEQGRADGTSSHAQRRKAGQNALLAAAGFSSTMQHTLLAHVVVGCALAFAGYRNAADRVFDQVAEHDLARALTAGQGDRGLHLEHLMLSSTRFVDRCLGWIKIAALANDSPSIYAVYLDLLSHVPPIDDRYVEASDLNERWPVLAGPMRLGSAADCAWLRAMEFTTLLPMILGHAAREMGESTW